MKISDIDILVRDNTHLPCHKKYRFQFGSQLHKQKRKFMLLTVRNSNQPAASGTIHGQISLLFLWLYVEFRTKGHGICM
jgi:hypothetical protein